ncbi:DUF1501 domain-containing protein [Lentisphaera profundi]|uniref:DUF1501 domain-containing protein n=1 Tax=Lentisphaera profundi TaxID=1658616 RepID=A0ABY7VMV5_9BACT|nr:DUF1501 domain-containing protein [Lentisphaera profundi]WDE95376.1 DUF1501 domain-containing protein [Lentisphaera profundi]
MNRRKFIKTTGASILGFNLSNNSFASSLDFKQTPGAAKHLIYLYMGGGMSHMDTFDHKGNHKNQGPVKAIKTRAKGVELSEFLPLLAEHTDKLAIVNSMTSTAGAHQQGNYMMHTSYEMRSTIQHPGIGAWFQKFHGKVNKSLPGSIFVGGNSRTFGNRGFFEPEYAPLSISNPNEGLKNSKNPYFQDQEFHRLSQLSDKLDSKFLEKYNLDTTKSASSTYVEAKELMNSPDLKAFDLSDVSDNKMELYGKNNFGQGCLLAKRLVDKGVRTVEVSLGGWDTHNNNFERVAVQTQSLDQAMSALLSDLAESGQLKDTLVVLATEFGRTPIINVNDGRDHYPKAFSCVLAGGPVRGGQKYGMTTPDGTSVAKDPVKIPDFNATIAKALGMPWQQKVFSPSKRPFQVAHRGKPIDSLLTI